MSENNITQESLENRVGSLPVIIETTQEDQCTVTAINQNQIGKASPSLQISVSQPTQEEKSRSCCYKRRVLISVITFSVISVIIGSTIALIIALNHSGQITDCSSHISISLSWDQTQRDLDLHVTQPGGEHVYFDHLQGAYGKIEKDFESGPGPETYFAECLPIGKFIIDVNQISSNGQGLASAKIAVEAGNQHYTETFLVQSNRHMCDIVIKKRIDEEQGFEIEIEH